MIEKKFNSSHHGVDPEFNSGMQHIKGEQMPDIHAVASAYIKDLFEDRWCHLFRLDLPAGETLADHDTGPRVIILLSGLKGRRVADGSELNAAKGQVMYLENRFAGAMTNTGDDLSYLVCSLHQANQRSTHWPLAPDGCQTVLSTPQCAVWQVDQSASLQCPVAVLHHSLTNPTVNPCQAEQLIQAMPTDVLIAVAGRR